MQFFEGVFKCEIKNRFRCIVEIDGKDTICYIPSSSRLDNYIDLKNKPVLLSNTYGKNNKLRYAVYAVKYKQNYICLNSSIANQVIAESIRSRRFSTLGKRSNIHQELKIDGYKCDLFIEDSKTIVEVKSILSTSNQEVFPKVYSQRAIDQLKSISELMDNGYNACYILISLNPYLKKVQLNQNDSEYYKLFNECIEKGMTVYSFSIQLDEYLFPKINKKVEFVK